MKFRHRTPIHKNVVFVLALLASICLRRKSRTWGLEPRRVQTALAFFGVGFNESVDAMHVYLRFGGLLGFTVVVHSLYKSMIDPC